MKSIKHSFTRAATGLPGLSNFWFMVIVLIFLNDDERRKNKRRKKRQLQAQLLPKPPFGPKPF